MNRPYKHIRLKQRSPEWVKYRHETGLGASEVASALATDSKELAELVYVPPIRLFLDKIDEPQVQKFTGNVSSFEGQFQEASIIHRFKFYDLESPDQLSIYKRMEANQQLNGIYNPNCVMWNPKYPFLYYSPDAMLTDALKSKKAVGCLEAKLSTSMEQSRYVHRTNPAHYIQLLTGMMITELPVGYVITLIDGKWMEVLKIEPNKEIFQWIEQVTAQFWVRVVKARKIKLEYGIPAYFGVSTDFMTNKQKEGAALLAELEPNLTGNEREVEFIKEMMVPTQEYSSMEGTEYQRELCMEYLSLGERDKENKALKNKVVYELIKSLNGTHEAKFEDGKFGHFSYKPDKNGKSSIHVSSKIKAL